MSSDNKPNKIQTIIAIATLILTPLTSGLVVNYQLTKGQEYWNVQKIFERQESYLDKRIKLLESINKNVLNLELSVKKIKLDQWALTSKLAFAAESNDTAEVDTELKNLNTSLLKYHKDLLEFSVLIQTAIVFYSPETADRLNVLSSAIENNFGNGPDYHEELLKYLMSGKKKEATLFVAELDLKSKYDTSDDLKSARLEAIKFMIKDINASHDIYKIK